MDIHGKTKNNTVSIDLCALYKTKNGKTQYGHIEHSKNNQDANDTNDDYYDFFDKHNVLCCMDGEEVEIYDDKNKDYIVFKNYNSSPTCSFQLTKKECEIATHMEWK